MWMSSVEGVCMFNEKRWTERKRNGKRGGNDLRGGKNNKKYDVDQASK